MCHDFCQLVQRVRNHKKKKKKSFYFDDENRYENCKKSNLKLQDWTLINLAHDNNQETTKTANKHHNCCSFKHENLLSFTFK